MKKTFIVIVVSAIIGSVATYAGIDQYTKMKQMEEASRLRSYTEELLGYLRTETVIREGKPVLQPRSRLLTASVEREYEIVQEVHQTFMGFQVSATVSVHYTAEFSYGYELKSNAFDIRTNLGGIEVRVENPILISTPAVKKISHKVIKGNWFTNPAIALVLLQQQLPDYAIRAGNAMTKDEAIKALCEKNLVAFLKDLVRKYPGMTHTPEINIVYK